MLVQETGPCLRGDIYWLIWLSYADRRASLETGLRAGLSGRGLSLCISASLLLTAVS